MVQEVEVIPIKHSDVCQPCRRHMVTLFKRSYKKDKGFSYRHILYLKALSGFSGNLFNVRDMGITLANVVMVEELPYIGLRHLATFSLI